MLFEDVAVPDSPVGDGFGSRGSPEHGTANLTRQSLLQHDPEGQAERSEQARMLLVPKAAAVARIAESLPFATAVMSPVPVFPMDLLDSPTAAERSEAVASRDPLRHVAVAKAASGSSPGQEFLSFSASAGEVEPEDAEMYQECSTPQAVPAAQPASREVEHAFDMGVQEVVTNAATHVAAAEARAQEAELRARASELQANEKIALMQRMMQESHMKAQADACAVERQKQDAEVYLQHMMRESAKHESQLQALRAETDYKLRLAEQALSRQASTAAPSVGSAAEAGSLPPVVQGLRKIAPDYFQNLWAQPQRHETVFMPGTQTQTQTQVETERDKNVSQSASPELAAQLTSTRPASTFASSAQGLFSSDHEADGLGQENTSQAQEAQGSKNQPGSRGPNDGDGGPPGGGQSPPQGQSPRDGRNPRRPKQSKGSGPPGGGGDGPGDGGGSGSSSSSSSGGSDETPPPMMTDAEDEEQQIARALRRSRRDLKARRYKEEDFKCPPLPEPGRYRAWKNAVQQNTAAASGRPDNKAIVWVQTAFDKSISIEDLAIVQALSDSESKNVVEVPKRCDWPAWPSDHPGG